MAALDQCLAHPRLKLGSRSSSVGHSHDAFGVNGGTASAGVHQSADQLVSEAMGLAGASTCRDDADVTHGAA